MTIVSHFGIDRTMACGRAGKGLRSRCDGIFVLYHRIIIEVVHSSVGGIFRVTRRTNVPGDGRIEGDRS